MNILLQWGGHPVVHRLGWTLLHFLWQGAAVAGLFALAQTGRRSSNVRYWTGCLALALMLAASAITFLALGAERAGRAAPAEMAAAPGPEGQMGGMGRMGRMGQGGQPRAALPAANPQSAIRNPQSRTVPGGTPATAGPDVIGTLPNPQSAIRDPQFPLLPTFVLVWLLGVSALSLRLLFGSLHVARLKRRGHEPPGALWLARLDHLRAALQISRPVRLLKSALVEVPAVVGWLRPVILLPAASLAGLTPAQLEAILAHELAHIRRHDYLVNLLQNALETLLFYHPAVWWISSCVRAEREICCDEIAVEVCGDRLLYAQALAALEQLRAGRPSLALGADGGSLLERIRRISGAPGGGNRAGRWGAGGALVAALVAVILLSLLHPASGRANFPPATRPYGLSLEIRCTNPVLKVGDEIPIQFILSNHGTNEYTYQDREQDHSDQFYDNELIAKTPSGANVPGPFHLRSKRIPSGFMATQGVLHSGETCSKTILLNRWALINEPGTYLITAKATIRDAHPFFKKQGPLTANSAPIRVTLLPRPAAEMDDYIRGLSNQIAARLSTERTQKPPADEELRRLVRQLAYTCSPQMIPILIRTASESTDPANGAADAIMYFAPHTEQTWKAIFDAAPKNASISDTLTTYFPSDEEKKQVTPLILRLLAPGNPGGWSLGSRLAWDFCYDDSFTARLAAIALSSRDTTAIYALAINRTDQGVSTLKTLIQDPNIEISKQVAWAILSGYNRGVESATRRRLRPEDFSAGDLKPLIDRLLAARQNWAESYAQNLSDLIRDNALPTEPSGLPSQFQRPPLQNIEPQIVPQAATSQTNAAPAPANSSIPPTNSSAITLEIRCTNTVLKVGDEIPIEFIISNHGTEDYGYSDNTPDHIGGLPEFRLVASNAAGGPVPDPRLHSERRIGGRGLGGLALLHPGASFSKIIPLNRWALIREPGQYEVTGAYLGNQYTDNPITLATSRSINITVLPRAKEEMDDYVKGLTNQIAAHLPIKRGEHSEYDSVLEELMAKLAYAGSPESLPTLLTMVCEDAHQSLGAVASLLYYVPRTDETRKAILQTAATNPLNNLMEEILEDYDFNHDQLKPIVERALEAGASNQWYFGATLAAHSCYDTAFTSRLIAIAGDTNAPKDIGYIIVEGGAWNSTRAAALEALVLNRTDEGVKALNTLLKNPDPEIWESLVLAIEHGYNSRIKSATGNRLQPGDIEDKDADRRISIAVEQASRHAGSTNNSSAIPSRGSNRTIPVVNTPAANAPSSTSSTPSTPSTTVVNTSAPGNSSPDRSLPAATNQPTVSSNVESIEVVGKMPFSRETDPPFDAMWNAVTNFENLSVNRPQLLAQFQAIVTNFPGGKYEQTAKYAVGMLTRMIAEDEAHAKTAPADLSRLPVAERVRELIFQLRDQHSSHMYTFTLERQHEDTNTAADQLAAIGYPAAPQLLAAANDPALTRSLRDTYSGFNLSTITTYSVLTVGDVAVGVLERIAGRTFTQPAKPETLKKAATWWSDFQKKEERQMLIEGTESGDADSPTQARLLLDRYPDAAPAAVIKGARAATLLGPRDALLMLFKKFDSPEALAFLVEESRGGLSASRFVAAGILNQKGRPEAVHRMIDEWEKTRSDKPEGMGGPTEIERFLASVDSPEAIAALGKDLQSHSLQTRLAIVDTVGGGGSEWYGPPVPKHSAATLAVTEELLVTALQDEGQGTAVGTRMGKSINHPRVCDLAGLFLNCLWPDRYLFDASASIEVRDTQRIECQEVWRKAHNLPSP